MWERRDLGHLCSVLIRLNEYYMEYYNLVLSALSKAPQISLQASLQLYSPGNPNPADRKESPVSGTKSSNRPSRFSFDHPGSLRGDGTRDAEMQDDVTQLTNTHGSTPTKGKAVSGAWTNYWIQHEMPVPRTTVISRKFFNADIGQDEPITVKLPTLV